MTSSLITVLDASNQPMAPLPLEEVQRRLATGEFLPDQLAHTEGLAQWTPLSQVINYVAGSALPSAAPIPATPYQQNANYAGFLLRLAAYIIDGIILATALYVPMFLILIIGNPKGFFEDMKPGHEFSLETRPIWLQDVLTLFYLAFLAAILFWYFPAFEGGKRQATIGKMAVGIKVTDLQGRPIGYAHALGRTFAKMLSNFTCCVFYIGYWMAGFTEKKQALHDMIASTLVLRK